MTPRFSLAFLATLLALSNAAPLYAENSRYTTHGFVSQGFVYSTTNEFYGESTDGSWEYFEIGINGTAQISDQLLLSGQLLSRDAGATDNGSVRADYLFVDYRAVDVPETALGIRVGRVRNDYGFYNNTRDVLFTRPSVLLPQSIYFEGNGVRELLFASDGAQIYSYWNHGDRSTSFTVSFGQTEELSDGLINNLFGAGGSSLFGNISIEMETPIFAYLAHDLNGGQWRFALSYLKTALNFKATFFNTPFSGALHTNNHVLSVQRNWERLTLTSEYAMLSTKSLFGGASSTNRGEGFYLQGEYRLTPSLTLVSRYDINLGDRENPNGSDSHDLMAGIRWTPGYNWVIAADLHGIRGTAGIPRADNPDGLKERSEVFALMASFRF